jgi:hypothetical protein
MDYYRLTVTAYGVRRTIDLELQEMRFAVQEARQAGFDVICVLLPRDAELMPGVLVEPDDLTMN